MDALELVHELLEENGVKSDLYDTYSSDLVGKHYLQVWDKQNQTWRSVYHIMTNCAFKPNTIVHINGFNNTVQAIANLSEPDALEKILKWADPELFERRAMRNAYSQKIITFTNNTTLTKTQKKTLNKYFKEKWG